jgi:hypothetical protein
MPRGCSLIALYQQSKAGITGCASAAMGRSLQGFGNNLASGVGEVANYTVGVEEFYLFAAAGNLNTQKAGEKVDSSLRRLRSE